MTRPGERVRLEELRETIQRLPPAELDLLLREVLADPRNRIITRRVLADLVTKGVLVAGEADGAEPATDAEVDAAADAFLKQYKPAFDRLANR